MFRTGMIDGNGEISINPPTRFVTAAEVQPNPSYEKRLFERKLRWLRDQGESEDQSYTNKYSGVEFD